jgi:hypothetical protein
MTKKIQVNWLNIFENWCNYVEILVKKEPKDGSEVALGRGSRSTGHSMSIGKTIFFVLYILCWGLISGDYI